MHTKKYSDILAGDIRMKQAQRFSRLMKLTGLILLFVSCTQTPPQISTTPTARSSQPTVVVTDTPTLTPIVASVVNMKPVPKDCPLGPPLHPQHFPGTILIGTSPVWAWPTGDAHQVVHLARDTYSSDGGYPIKIVWEIGPNYTHIVTLRAGDLHSGKLLTWHMSPDLHLTTTPLLDPQHPGHPVSVVGEDWREWGSDIVVPTAGCYYVEATWSTGHWHETFAVGL